MQNNDNSHPLRSNNASINFTIIYNRLTQNLTIPSLNSVPSPDIPS